MRTSGRSVVVALLVCATALTACGHQAISYVDRDSAYTTSQLADLLERTAAGRLASRQREDAVQLRHAALVDLRSLGGGASEAASLMTRTFPATTPSVPLRVERASVDGQDAFVVIEAWGPPGGRLSARRLWALDARTGAVLFSASVGSGG